MRGPLRVSSDCYGVTRSRRSRHPEPTSTSRRPHHRRCRRARGRHPATAFAVTVAGTVQIAPAGRRAFASVTEIVPSARRLEVHVDVLVRRGPRGDVEAVDDDPPRTRCRVVDRHRLLGVSVRGLPGEHAGPARAVVDEEVEVGCRIATGCRSSRAATRLRQARRHRTCCCAEDARSVGVRRSALPMVVPDRPAGERAEQVRHACSSGRPAPRSSPSDVSGFGETLAPRMVAVNVYGAAAGYESDRR